jgi:hypothetical protein
MTGREEMRSLKKTARIAGILILALTPFAFFSMMYVPSNLVVPGDAAATGANIMASEGLFRFGMISDSIVFLIEIVLIAVLYVLLRPVNRTVSLAAAFARLAMTIVQGINLLNYFSALQLLGGAAYLNVFDVQQLQALMLLFLNMQELTTHVWGLFFALHLVFIGYLVYKSGYIPGIIGIVLIVAAGCYFIQSWGIILLPAYESTFTVIGLVSIIELAFPLWLVIRGIKDQTTSGIQAEERP